MNDWDEAEQRVERARELFEQRRLREAAEELRAAIAINPSNAGWLFNLGLTLDELGRYDEAADAFRDAMEIEPDDVAARNHLGVDLCRTGRLHEALVEFEQIQATAPAFEPAYCNRIIVYTQLGEHDRAEEMFYLARLYKEDCPHCYYNIGCSLFARRQYDRAIYCWHKALDLDEEHPLAHLRLAEACWRKGDLERARQYYLTALRRDPGEISILLGLGSLLDELGRTEDAGAKFRMAMELAPDDAAVHYAWGRWLMRRGREDQAIEALNQALRLDPTCAAAHLQLARIYHARGRRVEALRHLRRELLLRPEEPEILLGLAEMLVQCEDSRAAIACLKRMVGGDPDHRDGWQALALAYCLNQRYAEGIASCRQVLRLDSANVVALHNLSLACQRLGQYRRALYWTARGLAVERGDVPLQNLRFRLRALLMCRRVGARLRRAIGR